MKDRESIGDCIQLGYTRKYLDGTDPDVHIKLENQEFHMVLSQWEKLARTKLECGVTVDDIYRADWSHTLDDDSLNIEVYVTSNNGSGFSTILRHGSPDYMAFITYIMMTYSYVAQLDKLRKKGALEETD